MVVLSKTLAARAGAFIGNGWLSIKDGAACARASSLIAARDCEIMRQMASVVEQAIAGVLEPVNGRRELLLPWQHAQLQWREEVGDVFQAEIDDMQLLVKAEPGARKETFNVTADGEVLTTTKGEANE